MTAFSIYTAGSLNLPPLEFFLKLVCIYASNLISQFNTIKSFNCKVDMPKIGYRTSKEPLTKKY